MKKYSELFYQQAFEKGWHSCINRWDENNKTYITFLQSELEDNKP